MKIESIKSLINQIEYRKYLQSLNSIRINKKVHIIDEIDNIISSGNYLFECGVFFNSNYGVGIVIPADWETGVIEKGCAKLFILYGTNYSICFNILEKLHQKFHNKIFWVQYDSQLSDPYVEIALENYGYHIATQYYQWLAHVENINIDLLDFSDRYDTCLATSSDADEIMALTNKFPEPGRFVSDPFIKDEGKKLYANWAYNSCINKNKSDEILVCKINNKIVGYETISFNEDNEANLGILRIDSQYTGKLLGYSILASSIKLSIDRGVDIIKTRTSKFNISVNKIYKNLGFVLSDSSIQFHWINNDFDQKIPL